MDVQLLLVMTGALFIAAFAHRRGVQAGIITVTLAAALSFLPGLPRLQLDPHLILGVVVPPLLYSATLNFSLFAFLKNLRSILGLGVGLVDAGAPPRDATAPIDEYAGATFDRQRNALTRAVREREIDPASATDIIREIDARQEAATPALD